jgi:hypothetical protein
MNAGPRAGELSLMDRPVATERLAAVAALLTLAVATAVLIVGLIRNAEGVLLALAGLVLLVTSGWSMAARRTVARATVLVITAGSRAGWSGRPTGSRSPPTARSRSRLTASRW